MWGLWFQLLAGLVALYIGAEWLVRGASALGLRVGLSALVIGLTVVAFGTSAPELLVSIQSGLQDKGDIAVGNVIGSNIANIALILGIAALVRPLEVNAQVIRREAPLVVGVSVLLCVLLLDGRIGRVDGVLLAALLVGYTVYSIADARRERNAAIEREYAAIIPDTARPVWHHAVLCLAGIAVLVVGADLLVDTAIEIAAVFGVSEALIGLTVVAVGTSLPELATSAVASHRREGDIAVGNVLGSNLFNILGILGVAALIVPLTAGGIGWVDLGVMLGIAVIAVPIMRRGFLISRVDGAVLVSAYIAYLGWLMIDA